MTNKPCATHHHACACREAKFAAYKALAASMREALSAMETLISMQGGLTITGQTQAYYEVQSAANAMRRDAIAAYDKLEAK